MKKYSLCFIFLPAFALISACNGGNPVVTTNNHLYVSDTMTATIGGQSWVASSFSLDTADLYGYGYINGIILTGAGAGDTLRLEIPFTWTDSIYAFHQLDTGYYSFGIPHPPPLAQPYTALLCQLSKDTSINGTSFKNFLSEDSAGHYQGAMHLTTVDSDYIAGVMNVNVISTGVSPASTIPIVNGYFVYSFRRNVQP